MLVCDESELCPIYTHQDGMLGFVLFLEGEGEWYDALFKYCENGSWPCFSEICRCDPESPNCGPSDSVRSDHFAFKESRKKKIQDRNDKDSTEE